MDLETEVVRHFSWIHAISRKYCKGENAKDLAEDTIYKILANKDSFDDSKEFKPWCETIMRNTYITIYNRRSLINYVGYDNAEEMCTDFDSSDYMDMRNACSILRKCARKSNSISCVIDYAKGYSYDEIAEHMNIPVGTVRSRISNGRNIIKREMEINS